MVIGGSGALGESWTLGGRQNLEVGRIGPFCHTDMINGSTRSTTVDAAIPAPEITTVQYLLSGVPGMDVYLLFQLSTFSFSIDLMI